MILSDGDIRKALAKGSIIIAPLPPPLSIDATTVDLRIGSPIYTWKKVEDLQKIGLESYIRLASFKYKEFAPKYADEVRPDANGDYVIQPKSFYLATTYEKICLPPKSKLAAWVEGKSTIARIGTIVHLTAPTIHCGFGYNDDARRPDPRPIALEIFNFGPAPLLVTPGETPICQLIFERVTNVPEKPYRGTHRSQTTALE